MGMWAIKELSKEKEAATQHAVQEACERVAELDDQLAQEAENRKARQTAIGKMEASRDAAAAEVADFETALAAVELLRGGGTEDAVQRCWGGKP